MAVSSPQELTRAGKNPLSQLFSLSWPWRIMFWYLTLMLFLPVAAMFLKASTVGPEEFWQIATSPIALSAYDVTFTTALITALINGVFGVVIAWVLVRYDFP